MRADAFEERYERRLTTWFNGFTTALLDGYQGSKGSRAGGMKAAEDWVDREEWEASLAVLLLQLGLAASTAAGEALLEQVGLPPEDYNQEATVAWLTAMSSGVAAGIVGATLAEADEVLADEDQVDEDQVDDDGRPVPPAQRLERALQVARDTRVPEISNSQVTSMSGFGQTEAVRSVGGDGATKTWRTTSTNPRPAHRRMDGETVGLDDRFSNGGMWPGDSRLDDAQRAGCKCAVEITFDIDL